MGKAYPGNIESLDATARQLGVPVHFLNFSASILQTAAEFMEGDAMDLADMELPSLKAVLSQEA